MFLGAGKAGGGEPSKYQLGGDCLKTAIDELELNADGTEGDTMQERLLTFMKAYRVLECSSCEGLTAFQHRVTGALYCVKGPEVHAQCYDNMMKASDVEMPVTSVADANAGNSLSLGTEEAGDAAPVTVVSSAMSSGFQESVPAPRPKEMLKKNESVVTPKPVTPPRQRLVDAVDGASVRTSPMPKPRMTMKSPEVRATASMAKEGLQEVKEPYLFTNCHYSPGLVENALVAVAFPWNATKYLITALSDTEPLESLGALLAEYALTAKPMTAPPKLGEIVVAKYKDDGYYRGKVMQVCKDLCKLMFVDYGDGVISKYFELLPVNEEIMKHPIYGLTVHLDKLPTNPRDVKFTKELEDIVLDNGFMLELCHKGKLTPSEDPVEVRLVRGGGLSLNETVHDALWPDGF